MIPKAQSSGMTLIELMVALGVATLVFLAGASVFLVVSASLRRQENSLRDAALSALDQMRHDLASSAQVASTNVPVFTATCPDAPEDAPVKANMAFLIGKLPDAEADFSRLEIEQIRYSVVPDGSESDGALIREVSKTWGVDALSPAVSNALLKGVTRFEVAVLADSGWTNSWSSSTRILVPRAARITLGWRHASTSETATVDVFLPAGNPLSTPVKGPKEGRGSKPSGI